MSKLRRSCSYCERLPYPNLGASLIASSHPFPPPSQPLSLFRGTLLPSLSPSLSAGLALSVPACWLQVSRCALHGHETPWVIIYMPFLPAVSPAADFAMCEYAPLLAILVYGFLMPCKHTAQLNPTLTAFTHDNFQSRDHLYKR